MTIQRKSKVIQPEEVVKIIKIIENSTSVGNAVKNLLASDADVQTLMAAAITLTSQAVPTKFETTRFALGTAGILVGVVGLSKALDDDEFTLEDVAASAAVVGGLLSRIPLPVTQSVGLLFNLLALAPVFLQLADRFDGFADRLKLALNRLYLRASRLFPHQDPLALDLDGDGIETRGADSTVLFDHNGDGIRTGTGWVRSDDGLLVLDRNSNGTIDTGAELFGVHTVKADGTQASDGFDALSDLDSNNDKVFDAEDTRFADVRIWRDLNQDGISQSNELSTLAAANIRSINLTPTAQSDLGNGNTQTASATFTRSDGTTGTAVNLNLAVNGFFRQFTNPVTLTDEAKKLPEVSGSGALRDLREAMSGSTALADLVSAYAKETSYAKRTTQLDALLTAWVGTSTLQTTRDRATANGFTLIYMVPGQSMWDFLNGATTAQQRTLMARQRRLVGLIEKLERLNGAPFVHISGSGVTLGNGNKVGLTSSSQDATQKYAFVRVSQHQINLLEQSYEQFKRAAYIELVKQTRLDRYNDRILVTVNRQGELALDFSAMNALIDSRYKSNPTETLADLIELVRYFGPALAAAGWNGFDLLRARVTAAEDKKAEEKVLTDLNVHKGNATGNSADEIFFADDKGSTLRGQGGDDMLFGGAGADSLYGGSGHDTLTGRTGNDTLYGNNGNDTLEGGTGNDYLYGGSGNDTLRGGAGRDYLQGDAGNDTYLFGRGDGTTSVDNYDTAANRRDILRFTSGIAPGDVTARRWGNHLALIVKNTGEGADEVITVYHYPSVA